MTDGTVVELTDLSPPPIERDAFFRTVIRNITGALQDTIGEEEAKGFVSVVGAAMGDDINSRYRHSLGAAYLDQTQVAAVLVDLKRRIGGEFTNTASTPRAIEFHNSRCPFGMSVLGRPSLCMMTSNVFGRIAAENLGYARVELARTIARGDNHCRVKVHLQPHADAAPGVGREYFAVG
nr:transcriptional regulator [Oceanococcus sp. HetDA_MAG_MS8]